MSNAILQVMGREKELLDQVGEIIRGLCEVGHSIKDIARRLKRSRTCVQAELHLQQVKSTTGRPGLLTSRDLRRVVLEAATVSCTYIQLSDNQELKYSARTVRCILLSVHWIVYTKMDCTLPLTHEHNKARQLWAKSHVMMETDLRRSHFFWMKTSLISTAPMV